MSVPEAVKRQEEEAQKLYEESYVEKEETPEEQGEESTTLEETPVETPSALEEEEVPEEDAPIDYQEQYFTLKGKYEAEVPRLHQEVQALKAHLDSISQTQPARLDDEDDDTEADPVSRLAEDYGEGFVDDLRTLFRSEFTSQVEPIASRLQQTEQVAMTSHRERYFSALNDLVPDWQNIVKLPAFAQYVQGVERLSGMPRYSLMKHAESQMDAKRMANFYNDFKEMSGIATTSKSSNKKMAALTPGQTSQKSQTTNKNEPDYVRAEDMQKFSTDVALRKYVGREKEADAIQARFDRAVANGWVL